MLASDLAKNSESISPHRYPNQSESSNHPVNRSVTPPPAHPRVSLHAVSHSVAPPPTAFQGTAQAVDKHTPTSADKLPPAAGKRGAAATVVGGLCAADVSVVTKVARGRTETG